MPTAASLQAFSRARIGKFVAVRVGDQLMAVAQVRGPFGKACSSTAHWMMRPAKIARWPELHEVMISLVCS